MNRAMDFYFRKNGLNNFESWSPCWVLIFFLALGPEILLPYLSLIIQGYV